MADSSADVQPALAYDLVIFDCDGTLVDSETLHNRVISDMLTGMGFPRYTFDYTLNNFAGKGMTEVVKMVETDTGTPLPASFLPDYVAQVDARLHDLMKPIEGALDTVRHVHGRIKICIGSNGERANVLRMLDAGGFNDYFPPEHIFTKNMVEHAKPAPDLFLYAAKKMDAAPARTLVIEDSVTGARAGVAAGMTVVGFSGSAHDRPAARAALNAAGVHHLTDRFADILGFLTKTRLSG